MEIQTEQMSFVVGKFMYHDVRIVGPSGWFQNKGILAPIDTPYYKICVHYTNSTVDCPC
jgi:hypothetical protein